MAASSSTLTINFSLRQNKAIERAIAFDALLRAQPALGDDLVYLGLGSLWFQDFQLAHRVLKIDQLISVEGTEAIYKRQSFNRPYASVEVLHGLTTDVVPALLERKDLSDRPWVVWLDYDQQLNDSRLEELSQLVRRLKPGSALLTTFNASSPAYAKELGTRREVIDDLFGDVAPLDLDDSAFVGHGFMRTLADCLAAHLVATAIHAGVDGGFIPAVRLMYRDSQNMVTVGGLLPGLERAATAHALVSAPNWFGFEDLVIETHPLTIREIQALTQLLPSKEPLEPSELATLGFELDTGQLRFFERHYLRYPTYAEIV